MMKELSRTMISFFFLYLSIYHMTTLYVNFLFQVFILFLENKRDKRESTIQKKENNDGLYSCNNHKNSL
jgi:hypothetical protein